METGIGSERCVGYAQAVTAVVPATARQRDRALEVLLSPELEPIVDMVGWTWADGTYEVAVADGAVRFRRDAGVDGGFRIESITGRNPVAVQDQTRFVGLQAERATPHPNRHQNSYPNAFEQFAQLFDHPSAPDLCVIHSAAHNWADQVDTSGSTDRWGSSRRGHRSSWPAPGCPSSGWPTSVADWSTWPR